MGVADRTHRVQVPALSETCCDQFRAMPFNESRINTVVVAVLTSNLNLTAAPGNVFVNEYLDACPMTPSSNVSQVLTIDRSAYP